MTSWRRREYCAITELGITPLSKDNYLYRIIVNDSERSAEVLTGYELKNIIANCRSNASKGPTLFYFLRR